MFYLDLDGQVNIRRDIDNEAFNNRLEISEAITDALSKQERPQNNSFMDFIHYFDYSLFERYVSNDAFDLRRYVQDVHLTRIVCYDNRRVTPLFGAFYLQHNADLIITRLGDEILKQEEMLVNKEVSLKSGEDGEKIDTLPVSEKTIVQSGLWLAPQLSLWARTRGAREFVQKIDRLCDHSGTGTSAGLLFTLSTLMLIYHQEYQSLEGILMGHFLREWLIQMLVIKMIVINIQKV